MRKTQTGSMLLEVLAVFALFALTLPIIFSKYAERNEEVDNRLIADNLRSIQYAMNQYIKSNYTALTGNQTFFEAPRALLPSEIEKQTVPITVLTPYLPAGFSQRTKQTREYKIGIMRQRNAADTETFVSGLLLLPSFSAPENRLVKIASLIGPDGGYVKDDGVVYSYGGLWTIGNPADYFSDGIAPLDVLAVSTFFALEELKFHTLMPTEGNQIGPDFEPFLYRQAAGGSTPPDKHVMQTYIDLNGHNIMNVSEVRMVDNQGNPTIKFVIINDPDDLTTKRFDMAGKPITNIGTLTQDGTTITAEKGIERTSGKNINPAGTTDLTQLRLGALMGHNLSDFLSGYILKDVIQNVKEGDIIKKPACTSDYEPIITFSIQNHQAKIDKLKAEEISNVSPGEKNIIYQDDEDASKLYDAPAAGRHPAYRITLPYDGSVGIKVKAETTDTWTVTTGSGNPASVSLTVHTYCRSKT